MASLTARERMEVLMWLKLVTQGQGSSTHGLREAILQKIPEFYEIISQTGGGGSTGFHISYSEIVIVPKFVENLNKDFIKA